MSDKVPQAKLSSAEWIAEAPSGAPSDFGIGMFGSDYTTVENNKGVYTTNTATDGSTSGPISAFKSNVQEVTMVSSMGVDEATPSSLTSDGMSFTVAWDSE